MTTPDTLDPKSLGRSLAALRRVVGLTQAQMAKKAKVSLSTYNRHESGREAPSARLLAAYARELGYLLAEFLQLHEVLERGRERFERGPSWWRNLPEAAQLENLQALETRKAFQEFETATSLLVERLRRQVRAT
jgi:transcriptional regulator with XRE-family HTH domain